MSKQITDQIETILGYKFKNKELLDQTFTHSSACDNRLLSNERLEFFGDSILGFVICQALYEKFPEYLEGDLTKIKSMLVSRKTCADVCINLGLEKFLTVGKGMEENGNIQNSLSSALIEAVIAALFIDGGMEPAKKFILEAFGPFLNEATAEQAHGNFKSVLQQYAQQNLNTTPIYHLLDEKGPDHDKCFESQVALAKHSFQSAWGKTKKEAEQKAAFNALLELGLVENTI